MRRGAKVVTPVIESAQGFGPAAVSYGSAEEIRQTMTGREEAWFERRSALLIFANQHPSEHIRAQAQSVAAAVDEARTAAWWLFHSMGAPDVHENFMRADDAHKAAEHQARELMDAIRSY